MLTYSFENIASESMYEHLYRCIKQDILQKKLRAGEKLPSKRSFAKNLGVSTITVESAYAQLVAEGFLYTLPKRGYYVCELEQEAPVPAPAPPAPPKRSEGKAPEQRTYWADFVGSSVARDMFPFSVWVKLLRDVTASEDEATLLTDTSAGGIRQLRQAIADHLYQFRGMTISPEQIVVGAGTEYLYNLLVQLLGRDRVYGVEDPGYSKAGRVYALNGAACVCLPVDGQGVDPAQAEGSGADILHLSPNHQFPTGAVMPIARRQSLLRWAGAAPGRYLIEDDYDSEFRFTGRPIPTLRSIDQADRVIYMNTFSRSLAPSLRIAYMVLPRPLLEAYQARLGFYSCTVPAMEQYTLARFLEDGHFDAHVNRMRVFYRARRDAVLQAIEESPLAGRCRVMGENAGLHFLLELDTEVPDEVLARQAEERGLRLAFLSDYQQRAAARPHTLVVNYPGTDLEHLAQALDILTEILDQHP